MNAIYILYIKMNAIYGQMEVQQWKMTLHSVKMQKPPRLFKRDGGGTV